MTRIFDFPTNGCFNSVLSKSKINWMYDIVLYKPVLFALYLAIPVFYCFTRVIT